MNFTLRLALLYAALFGAIGVQLPFLPVWLSAKGLDAQAIGLMLALATATRVAVVPFGTRLADHLGNLKAGIIVATCVCAASLALMGLSGALPALMLFYALASSSSGTAIPLTEAYALRGLNERRRSYGPVRVWGSLAFIVGTLATGFLIGWIGAVNIIWILVGVYASGIVAACLLTPTSAPSASGSRTARAGTLLKNPALLAVIFASGCIQASHALLYGFGSLQWARAGFSGNTIAVLWSIGVLAEIVLFAFAARLPPAVGALTLMTIGALAAALRWAAMIAEPHLASLAAIQCLHALSFGATHLGAVQYVARAAPPGLAATAQGLLATANGGLMAAAMASSGVLQARLGAFAYIGMVLLAFTGFGAVLFASRRAASAP